MRNKFVLVLLTGFLMAGLIKVCKNPGMVSGFKEALILECLGFREEYLRKQLLLSSDPFKVVDETGKNGVKQNWIKGVLVTNAGQMDTKTRQQVQLAAERQRLEITMSGMSRGRQQKLAKQFETYGRILRKQSRNIEAEVCHRTAQKALNGWIPLDTLFCSGFG